MHNMRVLLLLLLALVGCSAHSHQKNKNHTALDAVTEAMLSLAKTMAAIERNIAQPSNIQEFAALLVPHAKNASAIIVDDPLPTANVEVEKLVGTAQIDLASALSDIDIHVPSSKRTKSGK